MADLFDMKYDILMKEWDMANGNIGRLDSIVFTIRGWATAALTAAIAYAYTKNEALVCLLIIIPLLALWLLDGIFKTFQRVFISRNRVIEAYLSSKDFETDFAQRLPPKLKIPDMASRFGQGTTVSRVLSVIGGCFLFNVVITYLGLILLAVMSFLLIDLGWGAKAVASG